MTMRHLAFAILALCVAAMAHSHATSTSYLVVNATDDAIQATWDVSIADLHASLGLDDEGDGRITWGEIESHRSAIVALASHHLTLARGDANCPPEFGEALLTTHADEPHLSMSVSAHCAARGPLSISTSLFFDQDASQRTLLDITTRTASFTAVLGPTSARWVEPESQSLPATFASFVPQGAWHVWIGYDHVAFVLLLLLASVRSKCGTSGVVRDILTIVTTFTVAHSITLGLAATGTVHVPVRPVEVTIAASIVIAGLMNLWPRASAGRVPLAFGFGLVHGFGFANALLELGAPVEPGASGRSMLPALAGFNVGVELAQLAIVAVSLPLLLRVRGSAFYAARFTPAASLAAAFAGAVWLVQRI